jgi:integrase
VSNSIRRRRPRNHQSAKPHPDFPLTAHPSGRWCKKIRGRVHYFGKLEEPQAALEKWLAQKDDLLAGRVPRDPSAEGQTLRELANAFLTHKQALMTAGELSATTFTTYHQTCANLVEHFGRTRLLTDFRQEDFAAYRAKLAKRLGPVALGNEIQRTRGVFKFGLESGTITTPVLFGPGFKRPSKKTLRLARAKKGPQLYTADEIRKLIGAAGVPLRAMILLACNAGLGNSDLANMPRSAADLEAGWVTYPRPKTGVDRRFPLWPETAETLREAIAERPEPKQEADAGLLFVTKYGGRWCKAVSEAGGRRYNDDAIAKEFVKLFALAGLSRKPRCGFYTLRHVFETVAGGSRDQVAVNHVMGHADTSMAGVYREHIEDARLLAVINHVRRWLWPDRAASSAAGV